LYTSQLKLIGTALGFLTRQRPLHVLVKVRVVKVVGLVAGLYSPGWMAMARSVVSRFMLVSKDTVTLGGRDTGHGLAREA
jgi:hypothetical protein